jgi:competence protein ComEC
MSFARRPFLLIAPMLCFGIVAQDTLQLDKLFILAFFFISFFIVLLFLVLNKGKEFLSALLLVSFVFLGAASVQLYRGDYFSRDSYSGATSYLIHVDEIDGDDSEWRKSVCTIHARSEDGAFVPHEEQVLLILKAQNIIKGDVLMIHSDLNRIDNKNNPGEFDTKAYWNNQNIYTIGFVSDEDIQFIKNDDSRGITDSFEHLREYLSSILEAHLEGSDLAIAQALILGDKSLLSKEDRSSFSNAGAMHVLAVSGLHVGIVLYLLIFLFKQLPRYISKNNASLFALLIIWVYAGVTGFSPSVLRASFMFSLLVLGQLMGRRTDGLNILFFSAFVLLILNPLLIYNIGFQLSYLAMIGIFTLYKPIANAFWIKNKWLRKIWEGTAVGIAAQLVTVPLSLYYFHQFPNYFALSNLIVMLSAGVILGTGLLLFFFHKIGFMTQLFGVLLSSLLSVMLFAIQYIESIPGSVARGFEFSESVLMLIYFCLFFLLFIELERRGKWVLVFSLISIFGYTQYVRYENYAKDEIVIFNANQLAVVVKTRNQLICLFSKGQKDRDKLEYMLNAYQKVNPGTLRYMELINGRTVLKLNSGELTLISDEGGVEIVNGGEKWFVRTSYKGDPPRDIQIVDMPYMNQQEDHYNLSSGAFIRSL